MGEFYAWALTGQIAGLEVWSDADDRTRSEAASDEAGSMRIATRLAEQQRFTLRSRDGREVPVHLVDSGMTLRNAQIVTVAWAAREGAQHGHCIFVDNHTTGASVRLEANLPHIRSEVKSSTIAVFGALATLPAAFAILAWLLIPGALTDIDPAIFLAGAGLGLVVLFLVGAIVAKLVFDYLRSEDDDKIWVVVQKAIAATNQPPQRYDSRRTARQA